MAILVTGALGFIGSNLVPKLLKSGHNVLGFDNLSNAAPGVTDRMKSECGPLWRNFKFYRIDVRDSSQMQNILANEMVDSIVHLAAVGSVPRSFEFPIDTVSVNDAGFVNICYLASVLKITKLVFASSSSVKNLKSPYAFSKKQNEEFAKVWCNQAGINYVGLRFHNVYGPGQRADSPYAAVIPRFIQMKKPTVYGDGEQTRDFTFVDDVCHAIKLALMYSESKSGIYDIGTGHQTSLNQVLELLGKKDKADYQPPRVDDARSSYAVIPPAFNDFGWSPEYSIGDGLEITKKYFESLGKKKNEMGSTVSPV